MPWDNVEHYWKRSPLSLVGNVTTPSLIMTGEEDRRTPISESEQFYQALKLQKVDTVLIRVPGSPHGIAVVHHMISKLNTRSRGLINIRIIILSSNGVTHCCSKIMMTKRKLSTAY